MRLDGQVWRGFKKKKKKGLPIKFSLNDGGGRFTFRTAWEKCKAEQR